MSIAAPASYWYLRSFPIDKMSTFLDYIVYMTYDLHGEEAFPSLLERIQALTVIFVQANGTITINGLRKAALPEIVCAAT